MCKLLHIRNNNSTHNAFKFDQGWLERYPHPLHFIHDPINIFNGASFQITLHQISIQTVPNTVKNPQKNWFVNVCAKHVVIQFKR